jgi:hypothetical protein
MGPLRSLTLRPPRNLGDLCGEAVFFLKGE